MVDQKKDKDEEQGKGFVVKDKRFSAKKEEEEARPKEEVKKEEPRHSEEVSKEEPAKGAPEEEPLPEIDFINFMLSLSTSALIQLGVIPDPLTKETVKNLPLAKQTIDLIGMLKEKTKGNLSSDEERLTDQVLYDLRMMYVKAKG